MPELASKRAEFEAAILAITMLESHCCDLRVHSKFFMEELQQTRMTLSRVRIKVQAIAADLSACEYAQTRKEIAGRLRVVLDDVQLGQGNITYDNEMIMKVRQELGAVDEHTPKVLRILDA